MICLFQAMKRFLIVLHFKIEILRFRTLVVPTQPIRLVIHLYNVFI